HRARGGSAGARRDALGDGPWRHPALHAKRSRRGRDSRFRPRDRRGDCGDAGDGRRPRDPLVAVRDRRHARQPDRRAIRRRGRASGRVARLPGGHPACDLLAGQPRRAADRAPVYLPAHGRKLMAVDATRFSLTLSRRTRRRKLVNLLMQVLATIAALAAVAVLAVVIISVAQRGASALSWDFFTKTAATFGQSGGGVADALVGSLVLVALATAMAVPVGILIALYVSEFASPGIADAAKLVLDVLNGLPSIIIGIFVFALLVIGSGQAAWKGSFAIAIDIFALAESPDPADHARAWALGFVLISFVLVISLTARLLLARYRSKLER